MPLKDGEVPTNSHVNTCFDVTRCQPYIDDVSPFRILRKLRVSLEFQNPLNRFIAIHMITVQVTLIHFYLKPRVLSLCLKCKDIAMWRPLLSNPMISSPTPPHASISLRVRILAIHKDTARYAQLYSVLQSTLRWQMDNAKAARNIH